MTPLVVVLCITAAAAPHSGHIASAHRLSTGRVDSALVAQARQQPDSTRERLSRAFAVAASASNDRDRNAQLDRARRLAHAYARAWNDSFLVRQVNRFESLPPAKRLMKTVADSLRLAGNTALGREGAPRAMTLWRQSLRVATALDDPAQIAPALVALGAGFYREGQFDSAFRYLERGRLLAVRAGDFRTTGNALGILASVNKDAGNLSTAVTLYERASLVRARSGDTRGIAADQNNLGLMAKDRGDFREARLAFEKALAINKRDGRASIVALNVNNLASVASMTGEYARADSLYREALALNRSNGQLAEVAFVLHDLGRLQIRRGEYDKAQGVLAEALKLHKASGAVDDAVSVMADLASLQSAVGEPEAALNTLRLAEREAQTAQLSSDRIAQLALPRADLAIQFGTFDDADEDYRRAELLFADARNEGGRAQAQQGRALLMHLRGDDAGSLKLLEQVERSQTKSGDRRSAALTQMQIADAQAARGDSVAAQQSLRQAQQALRSVGDAVGEAAVLAAIGDLELKRGSIRSARQAYGLGLTRLNRKRASEVRWRLHAGHAESLRRQGSLSEAAAEYRVAIAELEQTAGRLRLEERRSGFLSDKWTTYAQLAMLEQSRGRPADAFAISERMRARQMLDLLARGRVRAPRFASTHEQDLRRRIDELTQELEGATPYRTVSRELVLTARSADAVRRELDATHKSYARLLQQIRERDPAYARLVSPSTVPWKVVASHLKNDEVMLEYLLSDSASTVFVVTSDTIAAIDLHASRETLASLVEFAYRTMGRQSGSAGSAFWRTPLRRLYAYLVQPVEQRGYLRGKRTLIIAPHMELHFLSFGALLGPGAGDAFLSRRYQLAYTPSATAWIQLAERGLRTGNSGVLALAPNVDRLPASRQEVAAIRRIYRNRASVRLGSTATEAVVRAGLRNIGTLHLATFGVLNKHNPLFSFVELAPGGADDGRLEVNEVFNLGLSGQLVVLSACQTALASGAIADVPPGDDWVGLVQAFLQAGAGSVMASLWPVDDRATARLMEHFHAHLAAGRSPVAALAEAQRAMQRNSATASPFYWAGFVINSGAR